MKLAAAIALAVLYVGLSLMFGGVQPRNGIPWWFFAPVIVTFCAVLIAGRISAFLPVPWGSGWRCGSPPRRVRLSWRTAVRIPAFAPVFVILWHFVSILRQHFDINWVITIAVPLAVAVLAIVALMRWREFRLLRNGEMAMGVVVGRSSAGEGASRIVFEFVPSGGQFVSGRGWDVGYGLRERASVPVFYDANNPRNHVIASACWFEAD